jgi:DNA mismatch repair protein MutL
MSNIIQLLPDSIANQIAAGEVIQRPASVIKELMENAIDAGATKVEVIIKDAGKTLIQIIDNGQGMSEMDARLSFERHATSKIKHAADLFNLATKGFRGEALASIAAIAHVELKTKQEDSELGTKIEIEGSKIVNQEPCAFETGSSFSIKNLFYNVPARRNFLKSDSIEFKHISKEFQRIALVHPEIHFIFSHNNKTLYNLPTQNLRGRIVDYFGKSFNQRLVPVNEGTDIVQISGFVIKPEHAKKQVGDQFFFVNKRYFKDSRLHHAVMKAFEDLIPSKSYPGYFIYLEVPPHTIDVNVHPTKTEIKFEDDRALYAILRSSVKLALGSNNIMPTLDFNADKTFDLPYDQKFKEIVPPSIKVNPEFNPFDVVTKQSSSNGSGGGSFTKKSSSLKPQKEQWESFYEVNDDKSAEVITIPSKTEQMDSDETLDFESEKQRKSIQVHKSYILVQIKSGLILIDQHRAHRRILFELYIDKIESGAYPSQQLLFPEKIELSTEEMSVLKELGDLVKSTGFEYETKKKHISLTGIPATKETINAEEFIKDLLETLGHTDATEDSLKIQLAKKMAAATAIRKNQALQESEIDDLVDNLFACSNPTMSPEGNKIIHTISLDEIQKYF